MILQVENIEKKFYDPIEFKVLDGISFDINRGEFVTLVGKSGSGKSTLLYILSTMDTDYTGKLVIDGEVVSGYDQNQLSAIRNEKIGFVFQFHYLLTDFTCLKNVMIPALRLGKRSEQEIEYLAM